MADAHGKKYHPQGCSFRHGLPSRRGAGNGRFFFLCPFPTGAHEAGFRPDCSFPHGGGKLRRAAFFPGTRDHASYLRAGDHGTGCGTILKSQPSKRSAAAFSRKAGVRVATDAVLPSLPVIRFSYRSFRAGGAPCAHCTDAFFKTPGKPAFLRKKSCLGARFPCTERGRTVA